MATTTKNTTTNQIVRPVVKGSTSEALGVIGYGAGGAAIYGPGGPKKAETSIDSSGGQRFVAPTAPTVSTAVSSDAARSSYEQQSAIAAQPAVNVELDKMYSDYLKETESLAQRLRGNYQQNLTDIENSFAEAQRQLESSQQKEQAITSTRLQRIGGYLGDSGSAGGVTSNQIAQHRDEIKSLAFKKAEAINAARNAFTKEDIALAQSKMKEAQDYENTIYQRRRDFIEQTNAAAKAAADLEKEANAQQNKIRDDARSVVNTMISSFGGFDFDKMDKATLDEIKILADTAGYPIQALRGKTIAQQSQEATERQRAISNAISQANLALRRQSISLSQQLSLGEVKNAQLPMSLVGYDQNRLRTELNNPNNLPTWFIDYKTSGGVPAGSTVNLLGEWNSFRNKALESSYNPYGTMPGNKSALLGGNDDDVAARLAK